MYCIYKNMICKNRYKQARLSSYCRHPSEVRLTNISNFIYISNLLSSQAQISKWCPHFTSQAHVTPNILTPSDKFSFLAEFIIVEVSIHKFWIRVLVLGIRNFQVLNWSLSHGCSDSSIYFKVLSCWTLHQHCEE